MATLPPDAALHLAALIASSDDAIVSKDLDGIVTSWNRGAERLFGYTAQEMIGRSITQVIPPERLDEERMVLERVRRGDRVEHFDTVRRRKDGTAIDISLTVSPIRDADGRIIGASKIARDISDRRRIEAELREMQHRLMSLATAAATIVGASSVDALLEEAITVAREVFHADGYALWRVDDSGAWRVVRSLGLSEAFVSRVITVMAGAPAPTVVPFERALPCETIDALPMIGEMREAYEREGVVSLIVFPLLLHGARRGTLVFYARTPCRYGEVDIQVGTAVANVVAAALTNVELYEAQRQAREAADQARQRADFLAAAGAALDASLDYEATLATVARLAVPGMADWCAVDILGDDGTLQCLALAHVDPERLAIARALQDRYPDDPETSRGPWHVVRTGQPVFADRITPAQIDAAARDEEHRRLLRALQLTSYLCVPLTSAGRTFGALTFASAESGRIYGPDDLRFARDLAARASLAVERARAYTRANEASRLKDEFLAVLSHELRTPLNAVLGYARLLRNGLEPEKSVAAIDVIERNANALKQIIEDVLDVSRIVSGRLRLDVRPIALADVVREACATVMPAAQAKGVRIETAIDPGTPPVLGDADRLQQVVWNLLSNAIKFTPRGGQATVRVAPADAHVEIEVRDTGRGIGADVLPYVFERFRQGDASFAREHGGLGLGLAIARQLTELHGGTIRAASAGEGRGATLTVSLPGMATPPTTTPLAPAPVEPRDAVPQAMPAPVPSLVGVRVLAIDDDADSLALVRTVLEGAGAMVMSATSAGEALSLIEAAPPTVIVSDLGMPRMDGLAFMRALREGPGPGRDVPAAALTAYARAMDRDASLASGYDLHLVKPVDPGDLIASVALLAARTRGSDPARTLGR